MLDELTGSEEAKLAARGVFTDWVPDSVLRATAELIVLSVLSVVASPLNEVEGVSTEGWFLSDVS